MEPRIAARARLHRNRQEPTAVFPPPPTTSRRGVMHMRASSAYTYALEIKGQAGVAYKIGWAFDFKQRARQFNQAALPALALNYKAELFELWDTARQAFPHGASNPRSLRAASPPRQPRGHRWGKIPRTSGFLEQLHLRSKNGSAFLTKPDTVTPYVASSQHPIHKPTLTKAALSKFTSVMTLLEGLFQSPPTQYPL